MKPVHDTANNYKWLQGDLIAVSMTHQRSILSCATEWMHKSKQKDCDMVKLQCLKFRICPSRINIISSLVLLNMTSC